MSLPFTHDGLAVRASVFPRRSPVQMRPFMTMDRPFEFTGRIRSVRHACHGIGLMLRTQHNAWIHAALTLLVIAAGVFFRLSAVEWCWIVLAIAAVWTAEALNTAFEFLADATTREFHPIVGQAKDVAAGAVLITAIGAGVVGALIFVPRVLALFDAAKVSD